VSKRIHYKLLPFVRAISEILMRYKNIVKDEGPAKHIENLDLSGSGSNFKRNEIPYKAFFTSLERVELSVEYELNA